MATEQEELRLTVTLVDNASANLRGLKEQIRDLGEGSSVRHVEKFKKELEEITKFVGDFSKTGEAAFKVLGAFRGGLVATAGSLALFGFELQRQLKDLSEYAGRLQSIGQLGKEIGVPGATIKNISEQLGVYRVQAEQAEAAITKFAQRQAELMRNPFARKQTIEETKPEAIPQMEAYYARVKNLTDVTDKLNAVREEGEQIEKNALKRGEQPLQAADDKRLFYQQQGYDLLLARAGVLTKLTAEEQAADAKRIENASKYSEKLGEAEKHWERIKELIKDSFIGEDSALMAGVKKLNELLGTIEQEFNKISGLNKTLPAPEGFWQRLNPFNQRNIEREQQNWKTWEPEQKKSMDENTDQLKKLTSLLEFGTTTGGPGGGGVVNAAYTTGPGSSGPGLAARGATPRSFRDADGYHVLPNGSDVGPGTGAGAGETPPGPISGGGDANDAIRATAAKAGMDPAHWKAIASIESGLNPMSNMNRGTQYKGLFQIGSRGAGSEWARKGHGNIYNARDNAEAAAALAAENNARFRALKGRDPTPAETYLMHLQGFGFYKSGTLTNVAGNPYPGMHGPQTAASFEAGWTREVERRAARFRSQTADDANRSTADLPAAGPATYYDAMGRPMAMPTEQQLLDSYRRRLDGSNGAATKVHGTGTINVNVDAPKNTSVGAEGGGLFNQVEINRRTQMEPAQAGPSDSEGTQQ
jgi:hypothetical protein